MSKRAPQFEPRPRGFLFDARNKASTVLLPKAVSP